MSRGSTMCVTYALMLFCKGGIDMMSDGVARANKRPMSAKRLMSLGRWV